MEKTTKSILDLVKEIPNAASEQGWVFTLDKDEGALFYGPKIAPKDTELFQVSDEYAVYLDKKLHPRGVVIEYYANNFVQHHQEFKKLNQEFFSSSKDSIVLEPKKTGDSAIFKSLLEKTLISDAVLSPVRDEVIATK